jgi:hypothetical protein
MLIRLLGKEAEATGSYWWHPFTDVDDWASSYVGYAYQKGITNGISATKFGGGATPSTAAQYVTFVLRALGYVEGAYGDFNLERSLDSFGFHRSYKQLYEEYQLFHPRIRGRDLL